MLVKRAAIGAVRACQGMRGGMGTCQGRILPCVGILIWVYAV